MRFTLLLCLLPAFAWAEAPHPMLRHSGLPIPRFVSLKSSEINVRTGPGKDYPIRYVYRRAGYPVEVIREFGHWRRIRDIEKAEGWVHARLLSGQRSTIVLAGDGLTLLPAYARAASTSRLMLEAEPGAILHVAKCQTSWCQIETDGRKGWMQKTYLWGVYENELFED